MKAYDFAIVGGGIVGLAIALELQIKNPSSKVIVFEKEGELGLHASGRNSGVLHAGFYYSPDSLKAKLTAQGNRKMREFASANSIPLQSVGKVVVAQKSSETSLIEDLHSRANANGVLTHIIGVNELEKIEPRAKTVDIALWSPNTAVGNPTDFVDAFATEFLSRGGEISLGAKVLSLSHNQIRTSLGNYFAGHVVNCAGLYADKIAKQMGFAEQYTMLPFMGLYWYAPKLRGVLKSHIYPTPDPRNPFLGVHLTRTIDGSVKAGPTAIPVLSREQYSLFRGLNFTEFTQTTAGLAKFLFSRHHDVPNLISSELPKLSRTFLTNKTVDLTNGINPKDFTVRGRPGIRAQLFDLEENKLEMDFVVQGDENSTHVLNAVSPAWTSSISFAEHVVEIMRINDASN